MLCLDANLWVYYLDSGFPEHQEVTPEVEEVIASEQLFSTTVVQMEVVHYVANQIEESETVVTEFLNLDGVAVAELHPADVNRASELLHEYSNTSLGGRDASILAAIERRDVSELWTHDHDLANVATDLGLAVHDPVDESADLE